MQVDTGSDRFTYLEVNWKSGGFQEDRKGASFRGWLEEGLV